LAILMLNRQTVKSDKQTVGWFYGLTAGQLDSLHKIFNCFQHFIHILQQLSYHQNYGI